jgi:hypothetical protein
MGIFIDSNPIGCGYAGAQSTNIAQCNSDNGVTTPNKYFVGPPGSGVKFGALGRNVFRGPWFVGLNTSLTKSFKLTEAFRLQVRLAGRVCCMEGMGYSVGLAASSDTDRVVVKEPSTNQRLRKFRAHKRCNGGIVQQ